MIAPGTRFFVSGHRQWAFRLEASMLAGAAKRPAPARPRVPVGHLLITWLVDLQVAVIAPGTRFFVSGHQQSAFRLQASMLAGAKRPAGFPDDAGGPNGPSPKRPRPDPVAAVATSTCGPSEPAHLLDAPFHLLRVRGIPDWANEGFLGIRLADLVRADATLATSPCLPVCLLPHPCHLLLLLLTLAMRC